MLNQHNLNGKTTVHNLPAALEISFTSTDTEVIASLLDRKAGKQRDEFLRGAIRLGVIAMESLSGQVDALRIQTEVDRMLVSLKDNLEKHQKTLDDRLGGSLKQYFDRDEGELTNRLSELAGDGGELQTLQEDMVEKNTCSCTNPE